MSPPTLRSLAKLLGLSAATVSLALRDSPRVIPATRKRVWQVARRAGYHPNPLVNSILAAVRRSSHGTYRGALLALNYTEGAKPSLLPYHREVLNGARRRAAEFGYSLELCWLGPLQLPLPRLGSIIAARNVQGVVVLPLEETRDFSAIDWSKLAAVTMDFALSAPLFHTVLPDHLRAMMGALERVERLGYLRPGLVLSAWKDRRLLQRWSAGFSSHFRRAGRREPVPLLDTDELTREQFLAWYQRHRPDVVLGHWQARIVGWLQDLGRSVPHEVGFVQLNWTERVAPCAGIDLQPMLLGAAAVESVVAQLQRNERGVPEHPKTITLEGRWVNGPTLRSTTATRAPATRLSPTLQPTAPASTRPRPAPPNREVKSGARPA